MRGEVNNRTLNTHATAGNPLAPPHPINTILNVNVEITKPRKPKGVAFAYRAAWSTACGTLGARYN
jgi:hypothetical protein